MRRLLLAAGIAVILHALLLGVKADWLKRRVAVATPPQPLTLSLQYLEPPKRAEVSQEKMPLLSIPTIPKIEPTPPAPKALEAPEIPAYVLPKPAPKKKKPRRARPKPESRKRAKEVKPGPAPVENLPKDWMQIPEELPGPARTEAPAIASIPGSNEKGSNERDAEERAPKERAVAAPGKQGEAAPEPSPAPLVEAVPVYRKNPAPRYPLAARRRGYEGTVVLEVLVNKSGRVEDLRLFRSSGYEVLDRAAMKSVQGWVFKPARRGDQVVEMWVKVPIRFQLE